MSKRYDICAPRKGKDKTFWHRIGTAWENEKGTQLVFDSLPLPDDEGRVVAMLFEPRDNSQGQQRGQTMQGAVREHFPASAPLDDNIPF